jgi:cell wall-associated NlpC family hydrolase
MRLTRLPTLPALLLALAALLTACTTVPTGRPAAAPSAQAQEVVLFALGLVDTGYRFGGKNPEAGLDCSGMVAYIFAQGAGLAVAGSAAEIAGHGRPVAREALQGGDLVFFNTLGRSRSHVGLYLGDGRFVHAPASNGRVRIDRLDATYYASRFEEGRRYFE